MCFVVGLVNGACDGFWRSNGDVRLALSRHTVSGTSCIANKKPHVRTVVIAFFMLAQFGFVQRSNHDFFVHGICHPTPVGDFSLDNALGFSDLIPVQDFWFQNACKILI